VPRPRKPEPKSSLHVILNRDLRERLDRHLGVGGRVPQSSYQRFFEDAIRQHFEWGAFDLGARLPGKLPRGSMVRGPSHVIAVLVDELGE
jgi:hypothetical protein